MENAGCQVVFEPIVCMDSGVHISREMLCRERPFPACADEWRKFYSRLFGGALGPACGSSLPTSINMDTRHILDETIWNCCEKFLEESASPARWILEWTEHQDGDHEKAAKKLKKLARKTGVALSVDDFGAGQDGISRVSMLENPAWIKIDGKLVQKARKSRCARKLMAGITKMAHDVGSTVIAEWVETEADRIIALESGADAGQGFLWKMA